MAYRLAVSGAVSIRGAIICGGDLPADLRAALSVMPPFPILLVHGENDPLADVSMGEEAEAALRDYGFQPGRFRHDQGHTKPDDAVHAIGEWINRQSRWRV